MAASEGELTAGNGARIASVDILRGIVMVLMALDHVREYFHAQAHAFDPLDPQQTWPLLYATRWVTHYCAPVFMLLAGVSAYLQRARGKSKGQLSRFLLTRGLFLVSLELTVIAFAWSFRLDFLFLGVIWAIGCSMIALAALVWLPWKAVLAIGLVIVAGHNLLDPIKPDHLGALAPLWGVLHEQAPIIIGGKLVGFFLYPLLPWIGVIATGYGLGRVFTLPEARRQALLFAIGGGLIVLFLVLRATNLYGDPRPWSGGAMSFLSTTKYPPSLLFLCMTLGPALLLLPLLERLKGRLAEPWITFGSVPLFFYVLHIFLAHAISAAATAMQGAPVWGIADVFQNPDRIMGPGYSLGATYLMWLFVVAALYLPCRWFADLKRRHPGGALSYV